MKRAAILLALPLLTGCNMVNLLKESTAAIEANIDAIDTSTCAIYENVRAIQESNRAIEENKRLLEENKRLIEGINGALKDAHSS